MDSSENGVQDTPGSPDVFIGIGVGKAERWATALDRDGRKIHDRLTGPCPATSPGCGTCRSAWKSAAVCWWPWDQPAAIGALAVAVARDTSLAVGHLPGGVGAARRGLDAWGCQDRQA